MYTALGPGAIGIRDLSLLESILLARDVGFSGLVFDIREAARLADERGIDQVRDLFTSAGIRPASWSVPGGVPSGPVAPDDLDRLPRYLAIARGLDCTRATTFLPPGSNERPYDENFAWTVDRLRPFAAALADAGCWLGLEFCGPKTFRAAFRHEFLYTIAGVRELGRAIGTGNIGILLDAFHHYTAGGTIDELDQLSVEEIVVVHVNDAIAGVPRDEQLDRVRLLPLASGVLEIVPFMQKLHAIGYDGPVMPEPFSQELEDLAATDPAAAAATTARSMTALWQASGLEG
ncbi:MAG: TIM barrel protein [Chloroflexia bacterium]|nr:TIM barrel protein [Chloroflexia bacterium]MDQ3412233.1 sugar phosphate isomerase/epimerase [Chloroflexota bacterium]